MDSGQTVYLGAAHHGSFPIGVAYYVLEGTVTGIEADGKAIIKLTHTNEYRADDGRWRTSRAEALSDCRQAVLGILEKVRAEVDAKLAEIAAEQEAAT